MSEMMGGGAEGLTKAWARELFAGGGLRFQGDWAPGNAYSAGDLITFGNMIYLAQSAIGAQSSPEVVGSNSRTGSGLLPLPAGTQVGDLLLIGIFLEEAFDSSEPTPVAGSTPLVADESQGFSGPRTFFDASYLVADSGLISGGSLTIPTQPVDSDVVVAYVYAFRNAQTSSRSSSLRLEGDGPGMFIGTELASTASPATDISSSYPPIGSATYMIGFGAVRTTGPVTFSSVGSPYAPVTDIDVINTATMATAVCQVARADWMSSFFATGNAYGVLTSSNFGTPADPFVATVQIDWKPSSGELSPDLDPRWQQLTGMLPGFVTGMDDFSSLKIGYQATAPAQEAIAIGVSSRALDVDTMAIGPFASAHLPNDVAVGNSAYAEGLPPSWALFRTGSALAVGAGTATAYHAVAVGGQATAPESTALGTDSEAAGEWSVAAGAGASARADGSVALGFTYPVAAGADFAIAIGNAALVTSDSAEAVIIGDASFAVDNAPNSVGIGFSAGCEHGSPNAVAIGYSADASGSPNGVALGMASFAGADSAIAIGKQSRADDQGNIAIGRNTSARAQNVVAIGDFALSESTSAANSNTAVGANTLGQLTTGQFNTGIGAFSLGDLTTGTHNTVIGEESALNLIDGDYNTFLGQDTGNGHTLLHGSYNTFVGCVTSVDADVSGAIIIGVSSVGVGARVGADDGIAIGGGAHVTDDAGVAIGIGAVASAGNATALGTGSSASGTGAVTLNGNAGGLDSVALGNAAHSAGDYGVTVGSGAVASARNSVAVGASASASGLGSIAIGCDSTNHPASAVGDDSIAIGGRAAATAGNLAVGQQAVANGTFDNSTAVGHQSFANGSEAVAVGSHASADGIDALCLGTGDALGDGAAAIGTGTVAHGAPSLALGAMASYTTTPVKAMADGSVAIGADDGGNGAVASGVNDFVLGTTNHKVSIPGLVGFHGATPVARASSPGTASGTDAAVINALVTILRDHGLCS